VIGAPPVETGDCHTSFNSEFDTGNIVALKGADGAAKGAMNGGVATTVEEFPYLL